MSYFESEEYYKQKRLEDETLARKLPTPKYIKDLQRQIYLKYRKPWYERLAMGFIYLLIGLFCASVVTNYYLKARYSFESRGWVSPYTTRHIMGKTSP